MIWLLIFKFFVFIGLTCIACFLIKHMYEYCEEVRDLVKEIRDLLKGDKTKGGKP